MFQNNIVKTSKFLVKYWKRKWNCYFLLRNNWKIEKNFYISDSSLFLAKMASHSRNTVRNMYTSCTFYIEKFSITALMEEIEPLVLKKTEFEWKASWIQKIVTCQHFEQSGLTIRAVRFKFRGAKHNKFSLIKSSEVGNGGSRTQWMFWRQSSLKVKTCLENIHFLANSTDQASIARKKQYI